MISQAHRQFSIVVTIVDFQAIEGSVTELIDALVAMDRHDAVSIVREALTFHNRHTGENFTYQLSV